MIDTIIVVAIIVSVIGFIMLYFGKFSVVPSIDFIIRKEDYDKMIQSKDKKVEFGSMYYDTLAWLNVENYVATSELENNFHFYVEKLGILKDGSIKFRLNAFPNVNFNLLKLIFTFKSLKPYLNLSEENYKC